MLPTTNKKTLSGREDVRFCCKSGLGRYAERAPDRLDLVLRGAQSPRANGQTNVGRRREGDTMGTHRRNLITYGLSSMLGVALVAATAGQSPHAQAPDPNSAPNPYRMQADWLQLPAGRSMGAAIAL